MTAEQYAKEKRAAFEALWAKMETKTTLSISPELLELALENAFRAGQSETAKNILDPDRQREGT